MDQTVLGLALWTGTPLGTLRKLCGDTRGECVVL